MDRIKIKASIEEEKMSLWNISRIVFVVFSLYLLGDAFYRWDGFRLHSEFIEFVPSVALVSIFWSIVALMTSLLVWVILNPVKWVCRRLGSGISIDHLLVYSCLFIISGVSVWKVKKLFWPDVQTALYIKAAAFIVVFFSSLLAVWLLRNRLGRWISFVNERITPLVWLFGALLLVSFPVVMYHTLFKHADNVISREAAQPSVSDKKRPNIILVTFDALSARNMSTYGYHRPTTPFITEWAKEATLFTSLEAESNWTTSTTASLMTGKRLWTHVAAHLHGAVPLKSGTESLPLLLKNNGYFNIALVANRHAAVNILGVADSFDIVAPLMDIVEPNALIGDDSTLGIIDVLLYRTFDKKIIFYDWIVSEDFILNKIMKLISHDTVRASAPPEKVFNRFLQILDQDPPEPYFAWVHIYPPHDPYLPPEEYQGIFSPASEFRSFKSQQEVKYETIKYLHQHQPFPEEMQPTIDILRSQYDEFLRYCDKEFENFIHQLSKRKNLTDPVIILSSDHGESFDNGYFMHAGPFLYETVTHIPLIVREPDQAGGKSVQDLVEQIDIPASILDFAGIPIPSWIEGLSLVPLIRGETLPPKPAFSMYLGSNPNLDYRIVKGSFAVRKDDYKLIHYLENRKSLLFNLKKDPGELNDIFEKEPETGQYLLNLIHADLEKANNKLAENLN